MDQTQDRMTMALKKISHFVPGGCWCLSSLSKELTVTPTPSSLELFSKDDPPSSTAALDQNKDWLSVMVDTADEEMVDAASDKPVEVFVQGVTHLVCEDVNRVESPSIQESRLASSSSIDVVIAFSVGEKEHGSPYSSSVLVNALANARDAVAAPFGV
ncbi:hypothetical protein Tco_0124067 [Tanacetum coccineum]